MIDRCYGRRASQNRRVAADRQTDSGFGDFIVRLKKACLVPRLSARIVCFYAYLRGDVGDRDSATANNMDGQGEKGNRRSLCRILGYRACQSPLCIAM